MNPLTKLTVEWKGNRFQVDVEGDYTIADLKYMICKKTGVKPFLQTFINSNLMGENTNQNCTLDQLHLTNDFIVFMSSILDEEQPSTSEMSYGAYHQGSSSVQQLKHPLREINQLIEQQANIIPEISIVNSTRHGKYLLVLDVDLTIYDCTTEAQPSGHRTARPYLQQFLTSVYEDYDIIIWSATGMKPLMRKMHVLGMTNNKKYSILSYMDRNQMISVPISSSDMAETKPLEIIWQKYHQYNCKNTLICDDQEKNYHLNKDNGVPIFPYSYTQYESDKELVSLAKYLKYVASFYDVSIIDHTCWKECL